MTIGERLEEARKRRGISIREAAEATKIRGDYLSAMEDNSMNIPLPEIYKRGFLRNYAKYLRLDPMKIMTDYDARSYGRSSTVVTGRESLGRMEIPDDNARDPEARKRPGPAHGPIVPMADDGELEPQLSARSKDFSKEQQLKWVMIGGGVLAVTVVILAILLVVRRDPVPAAQDTPAAQNSNGSSALVGQQFRISAIGTVTVLVEQVSDKKRLFQGTLNAGQSTPLISREGPVEIRFSSGESIVIEQGGRQFKPGQSGVGRTVLP